MTISSSDPKKNEINIADQNPPRIRAKKLASYSLQRILHYLVILHGVMTVVFIIVLLVQDAPIQYIIEFYLYISIIAFIIYGTIFLGTFLLQKREFAKIKKLPVSEEVLEGKALQVYWYVFTHDKAGVREIQKTLNLSSPGTVSYQLSKLKEAGILSKSEEEGKYYVSERLKQGVFKLYVKIGKWVVPRVSLYLIIYALGFILYLILALLFSEQFLSNPATYLLLGFLILGTIILIFQTISIRKINPLN